MILSNDLSRFQELVQKKDSIVKDLNNKQAPKRLKAERNATLDEFVSMLSMVLSRVFKNQNVIFIPDEGAVLEDPQKKLENTSILYKVVERVPKLELKARPMEAIIEDVDDEGNRRFGHTWSQRQVCTVQFDVIACDYITANEVMSTFEDTMFSYTGYFKSKGVAEMYFKKHYTDQNLDKYRQNMSVRSIQYFVEIEKLITVFDTTIEDIDV